MPLLIMAFIFAQSALPADLSSEESGFFVDWICRMVKADPEKYLDYVPIESLPEAEKTASIDARLKSLQEAQEETAQALQDMIAMQMEA